MIYVLTRSVNDYNQHGDYFVHAWKHKPSAEEIFKHWKSEYSFELCQEIANTGSGREREYEDWFNLEVIK